MNQADWIEEEKHPPLPPNCPYFGTDRTPFSFNFMENFHPWTPEFSPHQRKIIAAVARCSWLDEYDRLFSDLSAMCERNCNPERTELEKTAAIRDAMDNCTTYEEQWKLWGDKNA